MFENLKEIATRFAEKFGYKNSAKEIEEAFDDMDIEHFMKKLWRSKDNLELLEFLANNKWSKDIYNDLYDFLKIKVDRLESKKWLKSVKDNQLATDLVNKIIDYKNGDLNELDIYTGDYVNQISYIWSYAQWYTNTLPNTWNGISNTLQEYHNMRLEQNGYEYMHERLKKYHEKFQMTSKWKNIWEVANAISLDLINMSTNTKIFEANKSQIISLYNSMIIFLYWDNVVMWRSGVLNHWWIWAIIYK